VTERLVLEGKYSSTDVDEGYWLVWIEEDGGRSRALGNEIVEMVGRNMKASGALPPTAAELLRMPWMRARLRVTVEYLGEEEER
jgi:hypothetical protein